MAVDKKGTPEAVAVFAMTFFFVLFPLGGIVGGLVSWMIRISCPMWVIVPIGILAFLFAIVIWLGIIGYILRRIN